MEDVSPSSRAGDTRPRRWSTNRFRCRRAPTGRARRAGLQRGVGWSGRHEPAVHPDAPGEPGQDRWHATIAPDAVGEWTFSVEAFQDPYLTWQNAVTKKIAAGQGRRTWPTTWPRALGCSPPPRTSFRRAIGPGSPTRSPRSSTPTCRCRGASTGR
ncbi:maltotransferase domain-containing protein [Micromonospora sp. M12]